MLAKENGGRTLFTRVTPHDSEAAALETETQDLAALVEAAEAGGRWRRARPRSWEAARGALSALCAAAHGARAAADGAAGVKLPKDATVSVSVAKGADTHRAVAAAVLEPLTRRETVLSEYRQREAGRRDGEALHVLKESAKAHGKAGKAFLISNGKALGEVAGAGIAAPLTRTRERMVAWLGARVTAGVGQHKAAEAADAIKALSDAAAACALVEPREKVKAGEEAASETRQLLEAVRLLGGRPRSKRWKPHKSGVGWGSWGDAGDVEHVKRAVKKLAAMLAPVYGALGMPTGVEADGDSAEDAFGLAQMVEEAATSLPVARVIEVLTLVFAELDRQATALRGSTQQPMPDLQSCVCTVAQEVVGDMERAQDTRETVCARRWRLPRRNPRPTRRSRAWRA